ncbi:hypothetical protein KSP40_PGU003569 [Platanthera guangdongensis]|uniref:Uncharacterized protein n=1 Tax=Platanthera guangdongensis TaxID=2320717 RepID=A0ABR2M4Q0_9ASPA
MADWEEARVRARLELAIGGSRKQEKKTRTFVPTPLTHPLFKEELNRPSGANIKRLPLFLVQDKFESCSVGESATSFYKEINRSTRGHRGSILFGQESMADERYLDWFRKWWAESQKRQEQKKEKCSGQATTEAQVAQKPAIEKAGVVELSYSSVNNINLCAVTFLKINAFYTLPPSLPPPPISRWTSSTKIPYLEKARSGISRRSRLSVARAMELATPPLLTIAPFAAFSPSR